MIWLVVLGLAGWVGMQALKLGEFQTRIGVLERRLLELRERLEGRANPVASGALTSSSLKPEAAANTSSIHVQRVVDPPVTARSQTVAPAVAVPPVPKGPPQRELIRAWLEENGLAWAGGAALALGGLFLVAYAAQRGTFTPPFRIGAAVVVGIMLLAVSEWLRRRSDHPLAAAMAAGAGAATLYGAAWSSYWLYDFIGIGLAGSLLAAISGGLLALAFRYGEPLAVVAILGGFLAPAITGPDQWTAPALTAYLSLITLTGYAVAGLRRWGLAGAATLIGAAAWAVAGFAAGGYERVAALALAPVVLACAAVEWRRLKGEPSGEGIPADNFNLMPAAALVVAAVVLSGLWMGGGGEAVTPVAILHVGVLGAALLALATAFAARRGLIAPILQLLGWTPALGFTLLYMRAVDAGAQEAGGAALVVALAVAGIVSGASRRSGPIRFGAAAAALVALVLAVTLRGPVTTVYPWAPGAVAAVILLVAVVVIARRSAAATRDLPLALWIWAAGAAALYGLQQGIDPRYLPTAAAGLSLAAALAHARLGWRGFAGVMLGAATGSLAALLSPELFAALYEGHFTNWALAIVAGASAGLTYAGAVIASRADRPRQSAEALSTAAILIGVAGAGVLLRLAASSSVAGGGTLDPFVEAALRTVLILAAGLTAAQAVRADSSLIGRWRGQVLLLAGLAHGVVFTMLGLNPLLAAWKPAVAGPPLFDSLAVAFLVPAVLLGLATWKKVAINRAMLVAYAAGAALFSVSWAGMELRRLFQGASLHAGFDTVGRAEAGAYAVLILLIARGLFWLADRSTTHANTMTTISPQIARLGRWGAWGALGISILVFGYGASPWWGPIDRPLAGVNATALLFALYLAGAGAAFMLGGPATRCGAAGLVRATRMTVLVIAFALLNLVVRLGFRGFDMRPNLTEASLETWAFSAVWGLFGFGLLVYGAARRSNDLRAAGLAALMITLAKIFLFDMARLEGVIRAASFLAVGALLLAAAVLVRRLGGRGRAKPSDAPE